jgi:predicted DNA-binding WGR domain protein
MSKTTDTSLFSEGQYTVEKVCDLNFTALMGAKGVSGCSNKSYHMELHAGKDGKAQLFSMYGPTGGRQSKDYRHYSSKEEAEKEFGSIKRSKEKKGYKEIKVAIRAIGTEEAKKIVGSVQLKNVDKPIEKQSGNLHKETARLISTLMGSTNQFVITTLRCPLGQLSNEQIEEGEGILNKAEKVVKSTNNRSDLLELSNLFYSLIPHNLGSGSRGKLENLILDSIDKINQKRYDLDTLLDAKAIGATLVSDNTYDQYKSLDTELGYVDDKEIFKWIDKIIQDTYSRTHRHIGKIVPLHIWSVNRNGERQKFLSRVEEVSKECKKEFIPPKLIGLVEKRKDIDSELFKKANIVPLFHGTRTQNITGLLKKGLLIRPSGVVLQGAGMYGNGTYFGLPSKSVQYSSCRRAYYTNGTDTNAYLFMTDCALGDVKIPSGAYQFNKSNIKPCHSVYAKGGYSGVMNDEFVLYDTNQHNIRYIIEFTTNVS